jgi:hypothetical protein
MKDAIKIITAFLNPGEDPEETERNRRAHQASIREYTAKLKTQWRGRVVELGDSLSLKFRAVANSKSSESIFAKFTYLHEHQELEGLEFVMLLTVDRDIGLGIYAKKVRAVKGDAEYKHTAKDTQIMLSMSPETFVNDLVEKFKDHTDPLNITAKKLYKDAVHHVGERHVENDMSRIVPETIVPFDYAQEMLRVLKTGRAVIIDDDVATLTPFKVAALKSGDDAALKLKISGEGWPEDSILNFYITVDDLFNAAAVRKINVNVKSKQYDDSDEDHPVTLQPHPSDAASELMQEINNDSILSFTLRNMLMRAKTHMIGGTELD